MKPVRLDSLNRGTVFVVPATKRDGVVMGRPRSGGVPCDLGGDELVTVHGGLMVLVAERPRPLMRLAMLEAGASEVVEHSLRIALSERRIA